MWAKICTGALDDDGRVRLRVTDEKGAPLAPYAASADLEGASAPAKGAPALKVQKLTTPLARTLALPAAADANRIRSRKGLP